MEIGSQNRLWSFWKRGTGTNAANEPTGEWESYIDRWAAVKGETGMATIRGMSASGGVAAPLNRYSLRINYTPTITGDMQARSPTGQRYSILSVSHDEADREWTDVVVEIGGANG